MDNTVEVALITGGSRGIGKALATRMLHEGKQVVITGRDPDQLQKTRKSLSEDVLAIVADVSSLDDIKRVVKQIINSFGHIDILTNNAGIEASAGPTWQVDPLKW